jgi:hypothetical protein
MESPSVWGESKIMIMALHSPPLASVEDSATKLVQNGDVSQEEIAQCKFALCTAHFTGFFF